MSAVNPLPDALPMARDTDRDERDKPMYDTTRRIDILRMTPPERAIYTALGVVERTGAHTLLTDAVVLLQQAREKVADFIDTVGEIVVDREPSMLKIAEEAREIIDERMHPTLEDILVENYELRRLVQSAHASDPMPELNETLIGKRRLAENRIDALIVNRTDRHVNDAVKYAHAAFYAYEREIASLIAALPPETGS